MTCLKNTLSSFHHPKIKWNVPESGYFSCIYVDNDLYYNKIASSLQNKNIELLDTSACFLREYKK